MATKQTQCTVVTRKGLSKGLRQQSGQSGSVQGLISKSPVLGEYTGFSHTVGLFEVDGQRAADMGF